MKKIRIVSSLILGIVFSSYGQTNKIENTGNVGIGTTTPSAMLHIKDPAGGAALKIERGGKSWNFSIQNIGDNLYLNNSDNPNTFFTFRENGNLGIGTTNPSVALDVSGTSKGIKLGDTNGNLLFRNNVSGANEIRSYGLPLEIETRDTQDISFNSNNGNSKLMTIKGDGSGIGIGTTNPQERFQIGNTYTFHDGGHKVIGFLYKPSGGVDLDPLQYSSEIRFDPVNGNFFLGTSNTITTGPTARLSINKTGNVGIGTTNPTTKLDVNGTVKVGDGDWGGLIVDGKEKNDWLFNAHNGGDTFGIRTQRDNGETSWSYQVMTLQRSTGNVGIGTTTPDAKLAVNGNIHTKEVKVDLAGWPDYVFENDYNLPTLQQVENHIAEKGHLENIPSAVEVLENGIQLGEMNAKLLQKIEELTLYMIKQNKKTEELKILVTKQQKEIEILKIEIKKY